MNIYVQGVPDKYIRQLEHIIQLFMDNVDVISEEQTVGLPLNKEGTYDTAAIRLNIKLTERIPRGHLPQATDQSVNITAFVLLEMMDEEQSGHVQTYSAQFTHTCHISEQFIAEQHLDSIWQRSKTWQQAAMHAIKHAVLQLFEQYSGIVQPWGILTGIRPTKLMHRHYEAHADAKRAMDDLQKKYRISSEKTSLMRHIVERQLDVIPDLHQLKNEVSVYIGIPFCPTKCAYCTFPAYAISGQQGAVDTFLEGLHYEMSQVGNWLKHHNMNVTTIYFGGGTPTSIEAEQMDALYEHMMDVFPNIENVREITVEAGRPDTITAQKLDVLNKHRIDRISINPQSYKDETLQAIGRHHSVTETIDKYKLARDMGITNINMDLIIGLPGEGVADLEHSLNETEKLKPESLTVHTLSFKRASTMTRNKHKYKVANRAEIQKMMDLATEWTTNQGYAPYYLYRQKNILGNLENIGYAFPGNESVYNIMIMEEKQTIIGLGCGAASKFVHPMSNKITRFANPKEPRAYNEQYEHYTEQKINILNEVFDLLPS